MQLALILAIFAVMAILGPFAVLWSLNTLFPVLAIPYDFWTWLAVNALHLFIRSALSITIKA